MGVPIPYGATFGKIVLGSTRKETEKMMTRKPVTSTLP